MVAIKQAKKQKSINTAHLKIHTIDPSLVVVPEGRMRQVFEPVAMQELVTSMKSLGQLQPGVCFVGDEGVIVLVAGERRLRATAQAGIPFSYVLRDDLSELDRLRVELEENTKRANLTWKEDIEAKQRFHELLTSSKPAEEGKQRIEDTANELGISTSALAEDLNLAKVMESSPQVGLATNKSEAKKIVSKIVKEVKRAIALDDAAKAVTPTGEAPPPIEINRSPEGKLLIKLQAAKKAVPQTFEQRVQLYAPRIHQGDMLEILPTLGKLYEIVIFDPPWGVDYGETSMAGACELNRTFVDSAENYQELSKKWLDAIKGVMNPEGSILFAFLPLGSFEETRQYLVAQGFTAFSIPILWIKKGQGSSRTPYVWPVKNYEGILMARLGKKEIIPSNATITTPTPYQKIKKGHPTAKHPQVMVELLKMAASPGNKVLDPMAGSGMTGVACDAVAGSLLLDWDLVELNGRFIDLIKENTALGLEGIAKQNMEEAAKMDFRELEPGTPEWKEHWRSHKEDQPAMIEYVKSLSAPKEAPKEATDGQTSGQ